MRKSRAVLTMLLAVLLSVLSLQGKLLAATALASRPSYEEEDESKQDAEDGEDESKKDEEDEDKPKKDEDADEDDRKKKSDEDEREDGDSDGDGVLFGLSLEVLLYIGIGAAALLAIVIAALVITHKGKKEIPAPVWQTVSYQQQYQQQQYQQQAYQSVPPTVPMAEPLSPEPSRTPTAVLTVSGGELAGQSFAVPEEGLFVGREQDCGIRFSPTAPGVSRRHCRLFWQNGQLCLMDVGSTCGTFLARVGQVEPGQLTPNQPVALSNGDAFYIAEPANAFSVRLG